MFFTRRVPPHHIFGLPGVLQTIVCDYLANDTFHEPVSYGSKARIYAVKSNVNLVLAPGGQIDHIVCYSVSEPVTLSLPDYIKTVSLCEIHSPLDFGLVRMSRLAHFNINVLSHVASEWLRLGDLPLVDTLEFEKICRGSVSLGDFPTMTHVYICDISGSVGIAGSAGLNTLSISRVTRSLSIRGIKNQLRELTTSATHGDYDFGVLPDTLRRIRLLKLNDFDLARLVDLPHDIEVLNVECDGMISWSGFRSNGRSVRGIMNRSG